MNIVRCFIVLLILPSAASAEILVRHCQTAATCVWVRPAGASLVQVNRTGAPIVPLADVLPTERIITCYHDPDLVIGSGASCDTRVPGRTDLWELKSVVYATSARTLELSVDASNPKWDTQEPLSSNLLTSLFVRLYGGEQGNAKSLLDAAPWANSLRFRRESTSAAVNCFAATLALDTTGDAIPEIESQQTAEWCGTFADRPPVMRLAPPNGISGQAPAP